MPPGQTVGWPLSRSVLYARTPGVNNPNGSCSRGNAVWYARMADKRLSQSEGTKRRMDKKKRREILDTVAKLRVTDIRDGMDWVGLHRVGTVDPEIRPLWRTKAA